MDGEITYIMDIIVKQTYRVFTGEYASVPRLQKDGIFYWVDRAGKLWGQVNMVIRDNDFYMWRKYLYYG